MYHDTPTTNHPCAGYARERRLCPEARHTRAAGSCADCTYDALGRLRLRKEYWWNGSEWVWVTSVEVRYVYSGRLVLQERDGNNVPRVTYTRGLDLSGSIEGGGGIGGLLARTDNTTFPPTRRWPPPITMLMAMEM